MVIQRTSFFGLSTFLFLILVMAGFTLAQDSNFKKVTSKSISFGSSKNVKQSPPPDLNAESQAVENLYVFAKLYGYIRYFHPSTEGQLTDWDKLLVENIPAITEAANDEELIDLLTNIYQPIAPSVQIYLSNSVPPDTLDMFPPNNDDTLRICQWVHQGVEFDSLHSYFKRYNDIDPGYKSDIAIEPVIDENIPEGFSNPEIPLEIEITTDISIKLPLALYNNGTETFPRPKNDMVYESLSDPENFSKYDKSVQLASYIYAWNVFQHFFPYFDNVDVDWNEVLVNHISEILSLTTLDEFSKIVKEMVALLKDGHGSVTIPNSKPRYTIYLKGREIDSKYIVEKVILSAIHPGDEILEINNIPIEEVFDSVKQYISAASPQFLSYRASSEIFYGDKYLSKVALKVQTPSSEIKIVKLTRNRVTNSFSNNIENFSELAPGIIYVDLNLLDMNDFLENLQLLTDANGIVFDLRGYPRAFIIPYLTNKNLRSPYWCTPFVKKPDRVENNFLVSYWEAEPNNESNLIDKPKAFIMDRRDISYAETFMSFVEYYKLAPIVGEATAGTNGNNNMFIIPGGIRIGWTGMKVLKQDSTKHHGVGIIPTDPVTPTISGLAEGRDEQLEYALNLVQSMVTSSEENKIDYNFALKQNYPNPFNPTTTIEYTIPSVGTSRDLSLQNTKLVVYDILGRNVKTLVNEIKSPGKYEVTFNASQLASGIYFYRLTSGDFVQTNKMMLLR